MSVQSSLRRWRVALVMALSLAVLIVPTAAHATSTTVAPAGDFIKMGAFSFELRDETISETYKCKITSGTAQWKIPAEPANHNASGPIKIIWTEGELPISCEPVGLTELSFIEVNGWNLTFQGGSPSTASIEVQFGIDSEGGCNGETEKSPNAFKGNWTNGTTSPFVNSSLLGSGTMGMESGTCKHAFSLKGKFSKGEGATIPMEDKTKSTSIIKVTT